jgi:hypothetical protein
MRNSTTQWELHFLRNQAIQVFLETLNTAMHVAPSCLPRQNRQHDGEIRQRSPIAGNPDLSGGCQGRRGPVVHYHMDWGEHGTKKCVR